MDYDLPFLGEIDADFAYTGSSAVDLSTGPLRGRSFGGVALLWRRSLFQNVSVIPSQNNRVIAIKVITGQSAFIVCCVYMPYELTKHLPLFTECLGALGAIVQNSDVECVYMLGNYNAHPTKTFGKEMF